MIVDINSRIWSTPKQLGPAISQQMRQRRIDSLDEPTASIEAHGQAMEKVRCSLIMGFESRHLGASIPAQAVAEYVKTNPSKYLGFAGIDPTVDQPVSKLQEAVDLGLVGVCINPSAAAFHPTDTRAMDLYQACENRSIPLLIEDDPLLGRDVMMHFAQPYLLDEVARSFPELQIVTTALGGPWAEQALALVGKHPTVWADLSGLIQRPWQLYNALLLAHQQGLTDRILFGSGFPFCTPEQAIVTVYSVNPLVQGTHLPSIPREQLRSIVERDSLSCLGLKAPDQPDDPAPTTEPADQEEKPYVQIVEDLAG